jgi:hypothetical protein
MAGGISERTAKVPTCLAASKAILDYMVPGQPGHPRSCTVQELGSMTEQSFSVQPSSLRDFAQELQTQLDGIAAPMNALATQASAEPQLGAFTEAWMLGESQQSAIQQMYDLLAQVKQAIGFAENVTTTIASAYQDADEGVAASYGAPGTATASAPGTTTSGAAATSTNSGSAATTSGSGKLTAAQGG